MTRGQKIKSILDAKGISQYKLAKLCDVRDSVISDLVKDKYKNPSTDLLSRVSSCLNIDIDELIPLEDQSSSNIIDNLKLIIGDKSVDEFVDSINLPGIDSRLICAILDGKIDNPIGTIALIAEHIGIDFNFFYRPDNDINGLEKSKQEFKYKDSDNIKINLLAETESIYSADSELFELMSKTKDLPKKERDKIKEYINMILYKYAK